MINNKNGFTLIELTVAIAIIVILTALLLPTVVSYVSDASKATAKANAKTVYNIAVQTAASHKTTPGKISSSDADNIKAAIGGGITTVTISESEIGTTELTSGKVYIQITDGIPVAVYYESKEAKYP